MTCALAGKLPKKESNRQLLSQGSCRGGRRAAAVHSGWFSGLWGGARRRRRFV